MDEVCPSSVSSNFWELPKNGRGLSIVLVLIRHQSKQYYVKCYLPEGHPISGSFQKNRRGMSVIHSVLFLGASKKWTGSVHCPGANKTPVSIKQ